MSSDRQPSMLERYVGRASGSDLPGDPDDGEPEVLGCFGLLRGVRERAVSLELRRRTGECLAIPYGYIARMEFSPSGGILLCCGAETVRLRGINLNREVRPRVTLFGGLARHAVPWVCEADRAAALAEGKNAVVVESIEW
jgi:hypothetical protein